MSNSQNGIAIFVVKSNPIKRTSAPFRCLSNIGRAVLANAGGGRRERSLRKEQSRVRENRAPYITQTKREENLGETV